MEVIEIKNITKSSVRLAVAFAAYLLYSLLCLPAFVKIILNMGPTLSELPIATQILIKIPTTIWPILGTVGILYAFLRINIILGSG